MIMDSMDDGAIDIKVRPIITYPFPDFPLASIEPLVPYSSSHQDQ